MHKLLFGGIAAAAVGLAACGGTTYSRASAPAYHPTAKAQPPYVAPASAPAARTVLVASGPKGSYLTDAFGRALYVFAGDHGLMSACTGSCALHWPALVSSHPLGGPGVQNTALGTANGQVPNQVTYHGRLLYRFAGDPTAGATNGLAIPGWMLIAPNGTPFGASAPTTPAAAPATHPVPVQPPVTQSAPVTAPVTQPAPVQPPVTQPAPVHPPVTQPAPVTPPVTQPPSPTTTAPPMPNPIPQGGGGDGDGDNSGGPSDGDGDV